MGNDIALDGFGEAYRIGSKAKKTGNLLDIGERGGKGDLL